MALLQISEPGAAPDPHQARLAVGIDLGTTHSLVATVKSGVAEVLPDEQRRPLLPSIVRYFPGGRVDVGYEAGAAPGSEICRRAIQRDSSNASWISSSSLARKRSLRTSEQAAS